MSPNSQTRVSYLLFDGFSNMCLACAVEPLRAANNYAEAQLYRHQLVSLDGQPVQSSSGITIQPSQSLSELTDEDILFVVSGYNYKHYCDRKTLGAIRTAARSAKVIGGLDTGAWLLAAAGLLDGYEATIHWQELTLFEEAFSDITLSLDRFVIDRNRITCGGATSALDLMLSQVRQDQGEALALDVMNLFIYESHGQEHMSQRGARFAPFAARAPLVVAALEEMEKNIEEPVATDEIARRVNTSARTLDRAFTKEIGIPPGRYYLYIRLKTARSLIAETSQSMAEIAARTGFSSAATFSRAFTKQFGAPPRDFRRGRLSNAPIRS